MNEHTLGPWEADTPFVRSGKVIIAECWRLDHTSEAAAHRKANARLIAAAPTMFAYIAERAAAGDVEAKEILEAIPCR